MSSSDTIETRIESLAAGGDGVGRVPDGRALFVPSTAPGDRVRVRIVESRKRFARGALLDVVEPSPHRVAPRCPAFGTCGGCAWQHVDYRAQLAAKAAILREALARIGRVELSGDVAMTPSPDAYAYRSRARLLQRGRDVGYRMRRSHDVCAVDRCPVLEPALERALQGLARRVREEPGADAVEWEIAAGTDGATRTHRIDDDRRAGDAVAVRVGDERLRISSGVFAQGNALLLEALARAVGREAGRGTSLVELYAGAGLLTLELSTRFDWVLALESSPRAVEDLRFNLRAAGRTNVEVRPGRVERTLGALDLRAPDVVALDPPRTGVSGEAMDALCTLRPTRIVYLSCDPATLARDVRVLRAAGYRVERVEGFDLFPQTPHVEALATLSREPGRDRDDRETTRRS